MAARAVLLIAALVLSLVPNVAAARDTFYPQDKLFVRVLEWRPVQAEYRVWDAISGEYVVSPERTIEVPFLGALPTQGLSTSELADEIASRLQRQASLTQKPAVSISFAERADVYILGGVATPGSVPFSPDLTATKAIALSGGYYRMGDGMLRLERDVVSAEGSLRLATDEAARAAARLARLESELSENPLVAIPADASAVEIPDVLLSEEQDILDIRREARESRLASIENVRLLAERQATSVREKMEGIDRQIETTQQELSGVQTLVDRGLAVASRAFTLERTLADLEARRIDLELTILQAELQVGQAERDAVDVATEFRSRASGELQATRAELQQKLNSIEVASGLLREATVIAPEQLLDRTGNQLAQIRIILTRDINGLATTYDISPGERLQPGDVVEVQMEREVPQSALPSPRTTAVAATARETNINR